MKKSELLPDSEWTRVNHLNPFSVSSKLNTTYDVINNSPASFMNHLLQIQTNMTSEFWDFIDYLSKALLSLRTRNLIKINLITAKNVVKCMQIAATTLFCRCLVSINLDLEIYKILVSKSLSGWWLGSCCFQNVESLIFGKSLPTDFRDVSMRGFMLATEEYAR